MTDSGQKIKEWGGYLEACQTHDELSGKARELSQARADGLLTDTEYAVLVGLCKQRREALNGERNG